MNIYSVNQTKSLTCPSCGATLEKPVESNYTFCSYCGTKCFVDDGVERTEHTERFVDETEAKKIEADLEKERLKYKENERNDKFLIRLLIGMFVIPLVIALIFWGTSAVRDGVNSVSNQGKIKIPNDYSYYTGRDYRAVGTELTDLGFTNIDYETIEDLTVGWFAKEGEVKYISIDGDSSFSSGDYFEKDAHILITYHVYKKYE